MNKLIQASGACLMLAWPVTAISADEPTSAKSATNVQQASAELSVPPMDHIEYPKSRPDWCQQEPDFSERDHKIVVATSPCDTPSQCEEELRWMQRAAVATYVNSLLESSAGPDFLVFSDQQINDQLVARHYEGTVTAGGETKYEKVVQLSFTPENRAEIQQAFQGIEVGRRLSVLGFVGFVGTCLLVCSSGLLGLASRRVARREASLP
jgi:hypothetical protein